MRAGRSTVLAGLVACGFLTVTTSARAQSGEPVTFHGFGGWALGHSNNNNAFANLASPDTELNNYYFALNVAARPTEKLSVHSQAFWGEGMEGQELTLDYVFVQWAHSPELKFRIGKVLSPFGLYTETFDVGTLRPFYLLPLGMYGSPGLVTKSYLGAGITGRHIFGNDWEISYDLYGGEVEMEDFDVEIPVGFDPATHSPIIGSVNLQPVGREVVGTKLQIAPPISGLSLGVSFLNMDVFSRHDGGPLEQGGEDKSRDNLVAGQLEYFTDTISLRAEVYHLTGGDVADAGYAEAAFKFADHWQLAASYDRHETKTPQTVERSPATFVKHDAVGLGLNYWAGPSFVIKLNYYRVDGNVFAKPVEASLQHALAGTLEEKTDVIIVGTQFSF